MAKTNERSGPQQRPESEKLLRDSPQRSICKVKKNLINLKDDKKILG